MIDQLWAEIVKDKIRKQADVLRSFQLGRYEQLLEYSQQVELGDSTNREGHAAKVYFNDLFGNDFCRNNEDQINGALNYGYAVLLSAFNREICANGYVTQIGLFHHNENNPYNFASDLMEAFRPLVDRKVFSMTFDEFGPEEKKDLLEFLNCQIQIGDQRRYLPNAISIYCKGIFEALDQNDLSYYPSFEYVE